MNRFLVRFLVPDSGVVKASVPVEALSLHDAACAAVFEMYGGATCDLDVTGGGGRDQVMWATLRVYSNAAARMTRIPSLLVAVRIEALSAYACAKGFEDFVLQAIPNP